MVKFLKLIKRGKQKVSRIARTPSRVSQVGHGVAPRNAAIGATPHIDRVAPQKHTIHVDSSDGTVRYNKKTASSSTATTTASAPTTALSTTPTTTASAPTTALSTTPTTKPTTAAAQPQPAAPAPAPKPQPQPAPAPKAGKTAAAPKPAALTKTASIDPPKYEDMSLGDLLDEYLSGTPGDVLEPYVLKRLKGKRVRLEDGTKLTHAEDSAFGDIALADPRTSKDHKKWGWTRGRIGHGLLKFLYTKNPHKAGEFLKNEYVPILKGNGTNIPDYKVSMPIYTDAAYTYSPFMATLRTIGLWGVPISAAIGLRPAGESLYNWLTPYDNNETFKNLLEGNVANVISPERAQPDSMLVWPIGNAYYYPNSTVNDFNGKYDHINSNGDTIYSVTPEQIENTYKNVLNKSPIYINGTDTIIRIPDIYDYAKKLYVDSTDYPITRVAKDTYEFKPQTYTVNRSK